MNEKKNIADMTDFQVEDSYVEDGMLNVLVSRKVPPFVATDEQMSLFREIAGSVRLANYTMPKSRRLWYNIGT